MYNLLFTNAPPDNLVCTKFYRHSDKSVQKSEYTFLLFVYLHSGSLESTHWAPGIGEPELGVGGGRLQTTLLDKYGSKYLSLLFTIVLWLSST